MAIKVVQNVNRISPTVSVAATSNPIALKSGYLRVACASTAVYVETGGEHGSYCEFFLDFSFWK
jgi:hypothetical protein